MSLMRTLAAATGFVLTFVALGGRAAAVDIVPELSPGSLAGALTLLSAGVMMLTASRRRAR